MTGLQPYVSVVVPTLSRPGPLISCLDALAAQSYPRERYEVIVVDDGGRDPLDELIHRYVDTLSITLLHQANAGPGAARNAGAVRARGELIAFTDDDCEPTSDWLAAFARAHLETPMALLGGCILNSRPDNLYAETSQVVLETVYAHYNRDPEDAKFFASNNFALPAAGFRILGGFEAAFRVASEDRDLCDRWRWQGHRLRYVPEAVVRHAGRQTLLAFLRQHFNYGRGAHQYHRERAARGSGSFAQELGFHGRFLALVSDRLAARRGRRTLAILGLLGLWQIANTAGFLYAALDRRSSSAC